MATIDMTHRKLNFPPRFLPYLEKHRIFELLHECVELLVQVRPKDHVQFLRRVLPCAAEKKDKQRVVFLSPPGFDRGAFSELLAECLGIQRVSRETVEALTRERMMADRARSEAEPQSLEEESCICPGEGGEEEQFYPLFYPSEEPYPLEIIHEEEKGESEEETRVCVCPCVDQSGEKNEGREDGDRTAGGREEEVTDEDGDAGRGKGEWEGEGGVPCEPEKKKKRKKPSVFEQEFSSAGRSSVLEADYGLLAECEMGAKGWILEDFPTTSAEADALNALGVIPTHAVRIVVDEVQETADREYRWLVLNWTKSYRYVPVVEIRMGERSLCQLSKDACDLLRVMPHRHAPMLPRVVLIGSRGSGVTTQGQKLAKKYGFVHVEFETVMTRALQQDDDLSKLYRQQRGTRPDPEVEAVILERVLLGAACRNRGWVLTGYPKNIDQMRMLDIIATPPNRIIFVEVPARECFVRLFYRKMDSCLGDEYKIPEIEPSGLQTYEAPAVDPDAAERLVSHPRNDKKQVVHDIERYFLEKKDMMAYCGRTASHVDGNQVADRVFELIEQVIINSAPAQPPRNPLAINHGIDESYERLRKFRLSSGMYFNNLFLNPPERIPRL